MSYVQFILQNEFHVTLFQTIHTFDIISLYNMYSHFSFISMKLIHKYIHHANSCLY